MRALISLAAFVALGWVDMASTSEPAKPPSWQSEGTTVWMNTPSGRLKTRAYKSETQNSDPVLIAILHGDLPPADSQYYFALVTAHAYDNVIAVAVLRPGYADTSGDRSSGELGYYSGDNYTAAVVDDIKVALGELKARYNASKVVLVGHSGGGAVAANLIGRYPDIAEATVLAACACDPDALMKRLKARNPNLPRDLANPSLRPVDLVPNIAPSMRVRMVVGEQDDVTGVPDTQLYADALRSHGIDVTVTIVPEAGHNILFSAPLYQALAELVEPLGARPKPHPMFAP